MSLLLSHLRGLSVDLRVLCVKFLILVAAMLPRAIRGQVFGHGTMRFNLHRGLE